MTDLVPPAVYVRFLLFLVDHFNVERFVSHLIFFVLNFEILRENVEYITTG